jgi:hypothetical protein
MKSRIVGSRLRRRLTLPVLVLVLMAVLAAAASAEPTSASQGDRLPLRDKAAAA